MKIPSGPDMAVYETDFDALLQVLITDFTCEFSNSDEKLNTVKFTWRLSDKRPNIYPPFTLDIFDDYFNPIFT